jgi:hypothetical protein
VFPPMLKVWPAGRPLKAVSASADASDRSPPSDPPVEREPGQARMRDEAGGDGEPESLSLAIQFAENEAGLCADGPGLGTRHGPPS